MAVRTTEATARLRLQRLAKGALLAIEALYLAVRRLNRRTAYGQASYGFRDLGPLSGGPAELATARDLRAAEVERKLEELHGQVQAGRVSERAYKKACDRYRVRAVNACGEWVRSAA